MRRMSVILSFCLFIAGGCTDDGISTDRTFLGTFQYAAFDTLGHVDMRGVLGLYEDNGLIDGFWEFDDGTAGKLKGSIQDHQMALDLNPDFRDNNLLLVGTLIGTTFSGTWQRIGFPGILAHGTFTAAREVGT